MKVLIINQLIGVLSRTSLSLLTAFTVLSMTGCAGEVFYLDTEADNCYRYADDDHAIEDDNYKQLKSS